jgi:peptide/nickel transport system substrate-binding protein
LYPLFQAERILRTASYQALDELTVEWRGVPGYLDALYNANFYSPLPHHAWGSLSTTELLQAELSTRMPLGWGPYVIVEWTPGDHITLRRNPAYFRAGEGLPHFDNLIYRFVEDSNEALDALQAGECDLADTTAMQDADLPTLLQLRETGSLMVFSQPAAAWEWAAFGITSYDEQRPALFGQKETRQAVAMCINRQKIADQLFYGLSAVPDSYVPDFHPLANADVRSYDYDPAEAAKLLDSVGWRDPDNDPATPRIAKGVKGVPDGTPFEFSYLLVSSDAERPQAAQMIQASLAGCGIRMNIGLPSGTEYLAAGPEGAVFGRKFDMAQFALPLALEPSCTLYVSGEIPGPYPEFPKGWGGANVSGYQNSAFDLACQAARFSLPDTPQHQQAHFQAQAIFAEDLPVLPLYLRPQVFVTRPDFCGVEPDPSSSSVLWNLEQWDYGKECGK